MIRIPTLLSNIGIYLIASPSGKVYVGQSRNLRKRLMEHRRLLNKNQHKNIHLQNSYNKYHGEGFFSIILEYTNDTSKLTEMESWWMKKFNSFHSGFNQTIAADASGTKRSEETRDKISKITSRNWESEEFRNACFNGRAEYLSKDENRKKMSAATLKVFKEKPYLIEKHSAFMKELSSSIQYKEDFKSRMKAWRDSKTKEELSEIARKSANNKTDKTYEISKLKAIITRSLTQPPDTGIIWINNKSRNGKIILSVMARWKELNGKEGTKSFSTNEYGVLPSWKMAVSFRLEIVNRLVRECEIRLAELRNK